MISLNATYEMFGPKRMGVETSTLRHQQKCLNIFRLFLTPILLQRWIIFHLMTIW